MKTLTSIIKIALLSAMLAGAVGCKENQLCMCTQKLEQKFRSGDAVTVNDRGNNCYRYTKKGSWGVYAGELRKGIARVEFKKVSDPHHGAGVEYMCSEHLKLYDEKSEPTKETQNQQSNSQTNEEKKIVESTNNLKVLLQNPLEYKFPGSIPLTQSNKPETREVIQELKKSSSIDVTITDVQSAFISHYNENYNVQYVFARDSFGNYLFAGMGDKPILRSATKISYRKFVNGRLDNLIKSRLTEFINNKTIDVKGIITGIEYKF